MSRSKELLNNTLIFGISSFASKFLGFLMLPFYTSTLRADEFGTAELIITIVGLLIPIFSLSISEAVLRFSLDKSIDTSTVFTFGIKIVLIGFLCLLAIFPVLNKITFLSGHIGIFYLLFLSNLLSTFLNLFSRGVGQIKLVGIAGIISSLVLVISNIMFLAFFNMGISGYLISMILSYILSSIFLFFLGKHYRYLTSNKNSKIMKDMIVYSTPLIPNALSWWVNHTSNRYFLSIFCTTSDVGLFAAAARVPSILIAIQSVFTQAWQISAISVHGKEGNEVFFSEIFKIYNAIIVVSNSILITLAPLIAQLLFAKEYYHSWIYTPFLLTATVFGAMVGFYTPFYLAQKKTRIMLISTFIGAISTITFNLLLIPAVGPIGAAIANAISYFLIWLYLFITAQKKLSISFNKRKTLVQYGIIILQAIIMTFANINIGVTVSVAAIVCLIVLNRKEITFLTVKAKKIITKK